jgi:thiamine-phosphate pyrophosphorylase
LPPPELPVLYPLIDSGVCAARGLDPVALAEAYLRGGARILQLRVKQAPDQDFLLLADRLRAITTEAEALLIINDRVDIALMARADGVHVGQEDLPPESVRHLMGPGAVIGVSTHDRRQADEALRTTASYIAVGPVFGTETKDTGYGPRGLELVRYAANRGKPVVAIGGITIDRAPSVVRAGASSVAVITDLLAGDPEERVRSFIAALR